MLQDAQGYLHVGCMLPRTGQLLQILTRALLGLVGPLCDIQRHNCKAAALPVGTVCSAAAAKCLLAARTAAGAWLTACAAR